MDINKERLKEFFGIVYRHEIINDTTVDKFLDVLKDLSEREMAVISYRYGLMDNEPKSLNKVAEYFGVTADSIKNVEATAIKKLRHPTRSKKVEETNDHKNFGFTYSGYLPDGITFADINEKLDKQK